MLDPRTLADATPEEAAALVAALEQFIADHAVAAVPEVPRPSEWRLAALREGVHRAPDHPAFWA